MAPPPMMLFPGARFLPPHAMLKGTPGLPTTVPLFSKLCRPTAHVPSKPKPEELPRPQHTDFKYGGVRSAFNVTSHRPLVTC